MGPKDLNERDFECWNLAVHEYTCQVELDLETNVDVGSVDCWRPPECEATIGDLIET